MGYYSYGYGGSGRRKKSPGEVFVRLIVIAVVVVLFNKWFLNRHQPTPPAAPEAAGPVGLTDEQRAQIQRDLMPATRPSPQEGIAAIILVDTSGSMDQRVQGEAGKSVVKMQAARQAVMELVETSARLRTERLTLPVQLGIYEFSERVADNVRVVVPLGEPNPAAARQALERMKPEGGTPIGTALIRAKRDLDQAGLNRQHILIVTDGENTAGPSPQAVLEVMNESQESLPASVYFVAFDLDAAHFNAVKDRGGVVLPAADAAALRRTLDSVLTERILVE